MKLILNRKLVLFTALGAKLVFHQEDCRDVVRLEDILSGVSPFFSYLNFVATIVMIVLPVSNT